MSFTEQQIKAALSAAVDPNTGKDFVAGKALKNVRIDGSDVSFDIELGSPAKTQIDAIRKQVIAAVRTLQGIEVNKLGSRITLTDEKDEIHDLAVTINQTLERIEYGYKQQQQFKIAQPKL